MTLAVCQICKYPVWSYICPDCLSAEITRWLPGKLSSEFSRFSRSFLQHFNSVESNLTRVRCVRCHKAKEATLCSFCYITEAFHWLHERNRALAKTLFMALPVDSTLKNEWRETEPISYEEQEKDEGICEECGEFSEQTSVVNGRWVCDSCRDYTG
jgi:hypothetical protein